MLRSINKNILTGLITLLPVVVTLYLLYWFVVTTESLLGDVIRTLVPEDLYRPGTVSYTHLDVYKRQDLTKPSWMRSRATTECAATTPCGSQAPTCLLYTSRCV